MHCGCIALRHNAGSLLCTNNDLSFSVKNRIVLGWHTLCVVVSWCLVGDAVPPVETPRSCFGQGVPSVWVSTPRCPSLFFLFLRGRTGPAKPRTGQTGQGGASVLNNWF
jgi:hypothetical protein